jgi:hypothetical protein
MLTAAEYLDQRLENQRKYHSKRSGESQKRYRLYRIIIIILSAIVTLVSGWMEQYAWLAYVSGACGAFIAIFEGMLGLYDYQNNWVESRTASEGLKRERFLFETGAGPYEGLPEKESFHLLVKRTEDLLGGEVKKWAEDEADAGN